MRNYLLVDYQLYIVVFLVGEVGVNRPRLIWLDASFRCPVSVFTTSSSCKHLNIEIEETDTKYQKSSVLIANGIQHESTQKLFHGNNSDKKSTKSAGGGE